MLISMTGFGSASADDHGMSCAVELRSVNNRFFKAVIKLPDRLAALEPELDRILRAALVRGSIVLVVSGEGPALALRCDAQRGVLKTYVDTIRVPAQCTRLGGGRRGRRSGPPLCPCPAWSRPARIPPNTCASTRKWSSAS